MLGNKVTASNLKELTGLFRDIWLVKEYFFSCPESNPRIIDCGANVGMAALYFKCLYPNSRILCFEPNPAVCEILQKNITSNRVSDVTIKNAACGSRNTKSTMFVDSGKSTNASLSKMAVSGRQEVEVEICRVSDFIDGPVALVKIDVEGAECEVLYDLAQSGKISLVDHFILEIHNRMTQEGDNVSLILRTLEEHSFSYNLLAGVDSRDRFSEQWQSILVYAHRTSDARSLKRSR